MAIRGVLFVKWGDVGAALDRSMASMRRLHPELPIHVHDLPAGSTLHDKARMFDVSPFDQTLYLDVDTVVLDRLDYAFERAARHGLACCICESPWARRHDGLRDAGDLIEYNTGVLFFTRAAGALFERWKALAPMLDATTRVTRRSDGAVIEQAHDDQASFAKAVDELRFPPFVLPLNWNFRPRWHKLIWGPVKIWHDYAEVSEGLRQWNFRQTDSRNPVEFARLEG
jgi:hypothetical protein